jgi:hypothetical protein
VPKAALAAFLVTAPLALWNIREFFHSVVEFHFAQPFRPDALSFMAQLNQYGIRMPGWMPFLLTGAAIVFVRRRLTTQTAISGVVALILIVFFAFNKAAATNYYYLVIGILAAAVATADSDTRSAARP